MVDSVLEVMSVRLGNKGNHCYSNVAKSTSPFVSLLCSLAVHGTPMTFREISTTSAGVKALRVRMFRMVAEHLTVQVLKHVVWFSFGSLFGGHWA